MVQISWTAPRTWVTSEIVTSSIGNTHWRDNLIDLDRRTTITGAEVLTSQTTTSTTYTDLTTTGPAVTVTIGAAGQCLVVLYASLTNTASTNPPLMSFAISGATTVAAADAFAIAYTPPVAGAGCRQSATFLVSGLTAGSNTFTCKYKINTSGTAQFADRKILVTPLGS